MSDIWNAAGSGDMDALIRLLREGEDPEITDGEGRTLLFVASRENNLNIVRYLAEEKRVDANRADRFGWTPFFIACSNGHMSVVQYLADHLHVDVDHASQNGRTPFFIACQNGNMSVVQYLADQLHVDVELDDRYGWTPFFISRFLHSLRCPVASFRAFHISPNHSPFEWISQLIRLSGQYRFSCAFSFSLHHCCLQCMTLFLLVLFL